MFKIDIHTHILPKNLPHFAKRFRHNDHIHLDHSVCCQSGKEAFAHMVRGDGSFFRKVQANCWDPAVRIEECDRTGVDVQVLSTVPIMFNYWEKAENALMTSQFLNDDIATTVQKYPKRFVALGTVPLQDPELATQELLRCREELNLAGIQIGSHVGLKNLNHPDYHSFFAEAERTQAAIFVHPWDMMGMESMPDYWLPWLVGMPAETSRAICSMIFGGIFTKFPRLKVAFAHGGGSFAGTVGRIDHGHQVRPDLCAVDNPALPSSACGKFLVDSLVHDARSLQLIIDVFGKNCVALGSDYPFPLGEHHPGNLIAKTPQISDDTKELLYSLNALRWLSKDQKEYI